LSPKKTPELKCRIILMKGGEEDNERERGAIIEGGDVPGAERLPSDKGKYILLREREAVRKKNLLDNALATIISF